MIQLGAFTIFPMQLLHRVTRKNVYFFQKRQVKLSNDTRLPFFLFLFYRDGFEITALQALQRKKIKQDPQYAIYCLSLNWY